MKTEDTTPAMGKAMESLQSISMRVVESVASADGVDTIDLSPINEVIDAEALDQLYRSDGFERVAFSYHGYEVTIERDGEILLR